MLNIESFQGAASPNTVNRTASGTQGFEQSMDATSEVSALAPGGSEVEVMLNKMVDFGAITQDEVEGLSRSCSSLDDLEKLFRATANIQDPNNTARVFEIIRDWVTLPSGALVPPESVEFYSKITPSDIDMILATTGMDARKGQLHPVLGDIALQRNEGLITSPSLDDSDIDLLQSMYQRYFDFSNPDADEQRANMLDNLFKDMHKSVEERKKNQQAQLATQRTGFNNLTKN